MAGKAGGDVERLAAEVERLGNELHCQTDNIRWLLKENSDMKKRLDNASEVVRDVLHRLEVLEKR